MIDEISALELNILLRELKTLEGAKVNQIYQLDKKSFLFDFHKTSIGRKLLKVILPKVIYLTEIKDVAPEKPPGFCMHLRKKLKSSMLRKVEQLRFERILVFEFETREGPLKLIFEFFDKGNVVLCKDDLIISVLEQQKWALRDIRPKQKYISPEKEFDATKITEKELENLILKNKDKPISMTLATELGLGGLFSEEVCQMAKLDKKSPEPKELHLALKQLITRDLEPQISGKNILPFSLASVKKDVEKFESFSKALERVFTENVIVINKEDEKIKKAKSKIEKVIESQEKQIKTLEKTIEENQNKGNLIYNNYQLIKEILEQITLARKTMAWKEIKEKLKGHKIIKEIKEKNGEIILQI